jgi:hypothetical protein
MVGVVTARSLRGKESELEEGWGSILHCKEDNVCRETSDLTEDVVVASKARDDLGGNKSPVSPKDFLIQYRLRFWESCRVPLPISAFASCFAEDFRFMQCLNSAKGKREQN